MNTTLRNLWVGLKAILVLTLVVGVLHTFVMTGLGQLVFHDKANGSMLESGGRVVGSSLIGQNFTDDWGRPLPQYFQSRPSAAGDDGYDGGASGASNMGPEHPELVRQVRERRARVASFNGVAESKVPADALTASSSGLDPHISVAYADIQIDRVARARHMDSDDVRTLVNDHTSERQFGFLGEPRVNVLELNAALDLRKG